MECREAQRAMDELLNGALEHWAPLHGHVKACERCSTEWRRLQRLDRLARDELRDPVSEAELERLTAGVLRTIAASSRAVLSAPPASPRVALAAFSLVAVLLLGVAGGRHGER